MTSTNFNYIIGFVIAAILIYILIVTALSFQKTRYRMSIKHSPDQGGITVITSSRILNLEKPLIDHYLSRLADNLKYLSKKVDPVRCDAIKLYLIHANNKLVKQISEKSEKIQDKVQRKRAKLQKKINSMASIMFSNDQNEDDARSIILEIILNIEILIFVLKIAPPSNDVIDVSDIDNIGEIIYNFACYESNQIYLEDLSSDILDMQYAKESPFEDAFIATPKKHPGSFNQFVDFNKHQNINENTPHARNHIFSRQKQKESLKGIKKTSMGLARIRKEKYRESFPKKLQAPNGLDRDQVRDRISQAQEDFISSRPDRYKKRKNSLVDDYNQIEDSTLHPALAFAY